MRGKAWAEGRQVSCGQTADGSRLVTPAGVDRGPANRGLGVGAGTPHPVTDRHTARSQTTAGVLVDGTATAAEAGFTCPVALTQEAWADCVAWSAATRPRQGRLHRPEPGSGATDSGSYAGAQTSPRPTSTRPTESLWTTADGVAAEARDCCVRLPRTTATLQAQRPPAPEQARPVGRTALVGRQNGASALGEPGDTAPRSDHLRYTGRSPSHRPLHVRPVRSRV